MDYLKKKLSDLGLCVVEKEPMSKHTTMRVGGVADLFCSPSSAYQVALALSQAVSHGVNFAVIGNGSNIVCRDGGFRGLVIELGDSFSKISVVGNVIKAQAGAMLSKLSALAMQNSLTGLEFAHGIPGSVGGAVAMNAGAYSGEIKDVLTEALVYDRGEIITLKRDDMRMGYRTTRMLEEGMTVLEAVFTLENGDAEIISAKMNELDEKRRSKQPLNFPSSGSTFKRPEGYFAGALIEAAGLKGARVGGACVSEKHAGFIVNDNKATALDVLKLIDTVKRKVFETSGVTLETEVRVIGED